MKKVSLYAMMCVEFVCSFMCWCSPITFIILLHYYRPLINSVLVGFGEELRGTFKTNATEVEESFDMA